MSYRRQFSPAAVRGTAAGLTWRVPVLFLEGALAAFIAVSLYGDGSNGMRDFSTQDLHRHIAYALGASLPAAGTLMLIAGGMSLC